MFFNRLIRSLMSPSKNTKKSKHNQQQQQQQKLKEQENSNKCTKKSGKAHKKVEKNLAPPATIDARKTPSPIVTKKLSKTVLPETQAKDKETLNKEDNTSSITGAFVQLPLKVKPESWQSSPETILKQQKAAKSPKWLKFTSSPVKSAETISTEPTSICRPGMLYSDVLFRAGGNASVVSVNIKATPPPSVTVNIKVTPPTTPITVNIKTTPPTTPPANNNSVNNKPTPPTTPVHNKATPPTTPVHNKPTPPTTPVNIRTTPPTTPTRANNNSTTPKKSNKSRKCSEDATKASIQIEPKLPTEPENDKFADILALDYPSKLPTHYQKHITRQKRHFEKAGKDSEYIPDAKDAENDEVSSDENYLAQQLERFKNLQAVKTFNKAPGSRPFSVEVETFNFLKIDCSPCGYPRFGCQFEDEHYFNSETIAMLGLKLALGNNPEQGKFSF